VARLGRRECERGILQPLAACRERRWAARLPGLQHAHRPLARESRRAASFQLDAPHTPTPACGGLERVDAYTWRARTLPVIITSLPALVLLASGGISQSRLGAASGAAMTVLSALASQLGRDRGRELQQALWKSWGGSPTVQQLRHRGTDQSGRVERLHRRIEAAFGATMPSAAEELADPGGTDARYEDVIADARSRTRDRARFPLIFEENANYGFRRNMLGLRPFGLALAVLTLIASGALFALTSGSAGDRAARWVLPGVVSLILGAFWWKVVTPGWVRVPADAYAARLIESFGASAQ
jgi:hypothetical protein